MRSMMMRGIVAACVLVAAGPALATGTPIDISSGFTLDLNGSDYTSGSSYPVAGQTITIGGVDFLTGDFEDTGDSGVVQTTYRSNPTSINIDIADIAHVTTLYTLINSAFSGGSTVGYLDLNFSDGETYSYALTEGYNIRDHNSAGQPNLPGIYGTELFPGDPSVRLDAQEIDVPLQYQGLTLTSLTLRNTNVAANPFMVAATVVTGVPEAATWAMMLGGFSLIGATLRTRRRPATA